MPRPRAITSEEIQLAFEDEAVRAAFPPILTPEQFAQLFAVSLSTAYDLISRGFFNGAVTHVGKHLRIWRNRAIAIAFARQHTKGAINRDQQQP